MSLESEESVIGSMMLDATVIDDVCEILSAEDFFSSRCRLLFSVIVNLRNKCEQFIDAITIREAVCDDELEELGGMSGLVEFTRKTPSAVNAKAYARVVLDSSRKRKLVTALNKSLSQVSEAVSYDDALSGINQILSFTSDTDTQEIAKFDEILKNRIEELNRRFNSVGVDGMTTGFRAIDERIMGLKPGDYWVVGARPSMGKTVFLCNIASHAVAQGKRVLFFSIEMTKEKITDRILIDKSNVHAKKFATGDLTEDDWPKLTAGVSTLKGQNNFFIIDKAAIDIQHLKLIVRKFKRKSLVDLIAIDYLSLITAKGFRGDKVGEISHISRELKGIAKETECPVICLAQLNRQVETRGNSRPKSSDLRESGQIEQDADIISFIHREEVYDEHTEKKGIAEIITTKFREGEIGTDLLQAELHYQRFKDLPVGFIPPQPNPPYNPYGDKK